MRSVVTRVVQGLAWLVLAGLVLEFYLAGAAIFGGTTYRPHRALGVVLALAILLLLVLALVARPGRRAVGLVALLVALTVVQVALPSLRTDLPWVAALHAVNAVALLGVAAAVARTTASAAPARRAPAAPAAAGDVDAPAGPPDAGGRALPRG
jgi:hypothetical protein